MILSVGSVYAQQTDTSGTGDTTNVNNLVITGDTTQSDTSGAVINVPAAQVGVEFTPEEVVCAKVLKNYLRTKLNKNISSLPKLGQEGQTWSLYPECGALKTAILSTTEAEVSAMLDTMEACSDEALLATDQAAGEASRQKIITEGFGKMYHESTPEELGFITASESYVAGESKVLIYRSVKKTVERIEIEKVDELSGNWDVHVLTTVKPYFANNRGFYSTKDPAKSILPQSLMCWDKASVDLTSEMQGFFTDSDNYTDLLFGCDDTETCSARITTPIYVQTRDAEGKVTNKFVQMDQLDTNIHQIVANEGELLSVKRRDAKKVEDKYWGNDMNFVTFKNSMGFFYVWYNSSTRFDRAILVQGNRQ